MSNRTARSKTLYCNNDRNYKRNFGHRGSKLPKFIFILIQAEGGKYAESDGFKVNLKKVICVPLSIPNVNNFSTLTLLASKK